MRLTYLASLLLCGCLSTGPSPIAQIERAKISLEQLTSLAEREKPQLVPTLEQINSALEAAQSAIQLGQLGSVLDVLILLDAAIATKPGGDVELGLITVRSIIASLGA